MANTKIYDPASKIFDLFNAPRIIAVVGNANEGKSNLLFWILETLKEKYDFTLHSYGLHISLGEQRINSMQELEKIHDSVIILDEFYLLITTIEDRRQVAELQKTVQQLYHRNNVVLFCGLPRNFNRFVSAQCNAIIYKRCYIDAFINGSDVKKVALRYGGSELGTSVLNVEKDEALVFDGDHYALVRVPYLPRVDTKASNAPVLQLRADVGTVVKNVQDSVGEIVRNMSEEVSYADVVGGWSGI